jgi:CRP-like cAMP-binding protein
MHTDWTACWLRLMLLILYCLLQTAFLQGEEADAMGIVVSGRIDVKMRRVDNNSTTVATLTEVVY